MNTSDACTMTVEVAFDTPKAPTLDQFVQTEVNYPSTTEVIKEVEVIREVHIREDTNKINDTDIEIDNEGHYKIFEQVEDPDDPNSSDKLTEEFTQRSKVSQIHILLGELKKHLNTREEARIKIDYVKKLYAEQLKKLVAA